MSKQSIRIVNETGNSNETLVLVGPNDLKLDGVTKIVLHPVEVNGTIKATLTFDKVQLDVKAEWDSEEGL